MSFRQGFTVVASIIFGGFLSAQIINADISAGCTPLVVKFSLSDTTTLTTVAWNFGNGESSNLFDPAPVTYSTVGTYPVSALIDGTTTINFARDVTVDPPLDAGFRIERRGELEYEFVPTQEIQNKNINHFYRWEISWGDSTNGSDTTTIISKVVFNGDFTRGTNTYTFPDTGDYQVELHLSNQFACMDTTIQRLKVSTIIDTTPPGKYVLGNVFAPNSPNTGGHYIIEPGSPSIVLSFEVFTRSGVQVYKTISPSIYWNGRNNNGTELSTGVYFIVLKAVEGDPSGFYSTKGFIHIFNEKYGTIP